MANLVTQFDNGTFEAPEGTWGQVFPDFTRSNDFAFADTYSAKLARVTGLGSWGQKGIIQFPAIVGKTYRVEAYVRTNREANFGYTGILTTLPQDDILSFSLARGSRTNTAWRKVSLVFKCNAVLGGNAQLSFTNFNSGSGVLPSHLTNIYNGLNIPSGNDTNNSFTYYDSLTSDETTADVSPQFGGRKLYYVENVFLLVDSDGNIYEIEEPIGWDKILINITFDKNIRGYKFEFTDKDATLDFDESSGISIIEAAWKAKGVDAFVGLKFGELDELGVLEVLYEGIINFSQYQENKYVAKLAVERQSLAVKFASRYDLKFELERTTTLNKQIVLPPLTTREVYLHAVEFEKYVRGIYNENVALTDVQTLDEELINPAFHYFTTVPPIRFLNTDIDGFNEPAPPDGTLIYAGLSLPLNVPFKQFTYSVAISFRVNVANNSGGMIMGFQIYKLSDIARDPRSPLMTYVQFGDFQRSTVNIPQFPVGDQIFSGTINGGLILNADEALFIKAFIFKPNGTTGGAITNFSWNNPSFWQATFNEVTPRYPTKFRGYKIFDVVERMVYCMTDKPLTFKSDFLETECGKDHVLGSGKQLRSIPDATMQVSMKDVLPSIDMLFNVGFSFERDNNGNEWGRLEPVAYFFQDVEMLRLNVIHNYLKRSAVEYVFNELEFGFAKFPQANQTDSANDFMTRINFDTPIEKVKGKLSKICQFILSAYYIGYTAAESFLFNSTGQYETDNDNFLIAVNPDETSIVASCEFFALGNEAIFAKLIPIIRGESLAISGTVSNNFTGVVDKVYYQSVFPRTVVTFTSASVLVNEIAAATTATFTVRDIPKRDEQFATITGVFASQTIYNLQHHLKRIIIRWSNFFQAGFVFAKTDPQSNISFLSGSNNTKVKTRLRNTETCVDGEVNPYFEKGDNATELLSNLDVPLFGNNYYEFEAPLTWQTLNILRKGFEGRHPEDKNYGYINFLNPKGVYEQGFLLDLKFNPVSQNTKIMLIEKYNG